MSPLIIVNLKLFIFVHIFMGVEIKTKYFCEGVKKTNSEKSAQEITPAALS